MGGKVTNYVFLLPANPSITPSASTPSPVGESGSSSGGISCGGNEIRGFITVDVKFEPNQMDARRVDVKFEACRFNLRDSPLDINFPLGIIGPTGE